MLDLEKVVPVINQMVEDGVLKKYAIGGASAVHIYSEPTYTEDIDFFIAVNSQSSSFLALTEVFEYLKDKGYDKFVGEHIIIEGTPVQFLLPYGLTEDALEHRVEYRLDDSFVITYIFELEYLMAIMVELGRPKDKIRLATILEIGNFDSEKFNSILKKHNLQQKMTKFVEKFMS